MACICGHLITDGIDGLCENNAGGIIDIKVTDACNIKSHTEATEGLTSAIEMEVGTKFYPVGSQKLTASLEENELNNFDNGSKSFEQILKIVIARRDVARRNSIASLGVGQKDLTFLIQDSNKTWWAVGLEEGVQLNTNSGKTGVKKADLNGYEIEFKGEASVMMTAVDPAIIDALLVDATAP